MTVVDLIARAGATEPARPFLTFYDLDSGERVELSLVTTLNWVAKTANLLQDTLGSDDTTTVRVDLPLHWETAVWMLATWVAGATLTVDGDSDVVVVGPQGLDPVPDADEVVALSLRPLGARFVDPLPAGVLDFNVEVPAHGDRFTAYYPPGENHLAVRSADGSRTHVQVVADADAVYEPQQRVLVAGEDAAVLLSALPAALAADGSLVLVRTRDPESAADRLAEIATTELVTD